MSVCERCRCTTEGSGRLCVLCFGDCTRECPECMQMGRRRSKYQRRRGRPDPPVCAVCGGDRYVTAWPADVIWHGCRADWRYGGI